MSLCAAVGADSASASFIVFRCGANLCRVNPDGSGQTQLTSDGQTGTSQMYGAPSLSRDGTKLAFVFNYHVIVADANANSRSVPFASTALVALIRPDGGQVAELEDTFSSPAIQLCTYNLDGSGRNCPYGTASAGWAPDNNLLISVGAGAPNYNQQICHVPAGGPSSVPCDARADDLMNDLHDPAVSPDGSTLAVTVGQGIGGPVSGHIALYNFATGQFERDLTTGTSDELPAWSPDGRSIAFDRDSGMWVVPADGSGPPRRIATGDEPTWGGPPDDSGNAGGREGSGGGGGKDADEIRRVTLAAHTVKRGRPVTFKVTLKAAATIRIQVLRYAPASGRGKHRKKAHYKSVGTLRLRGTRGTDKLRITNIHGRELVAGRYEAKLSAGGRAHVLRFKVKR